MTHYQLLKLPQTASTDEIRKAYRTLSKSCHPDVCRDADAEERFKELGEAHDVLTDPDKRWLYDASITPPQMRRPSDSLFGFSGSVVYTGPNSIFTASWE